MKKLLQFACVLLLSSQCFAAIALVQSNSGGSATNTGGSITSSTGHFSSNTQSGNLLVIVAWATCAGPGGFNTSCSVPVMTNPTTSGFVWTNLAAQTNSIGTTNGFAVKVAYIPNASPMASSVTTTVTSNSNIGETVTQQNIEFSLYEFSGVQTSSPADGAAVAPTGSSSSPSGSKTTTATDVLMFAYVGGNTGSNLTAGGGFTLGVNAAVATVGQTEYALNQTAGSYTASYSGGTFPVWAGALVAFKAGAGGSTAVSRHKGWVF